MCIRDSATGIVLRSSDLASLWRSRSPRHDVDGTGAKVHIHKHDKHPSVCVECKLYHTLRVMGVEACAGVADDFIARQHAIRDDGSVDFNRVVGDGAVEELLRRERASIRFEHPVAGRCGATAAEVLARPRD